MPDYNNIHPVFAPLLNYLFIIRDNGIYGYLKSNPGHVNMIDLRAELLNHDPLLSLPLLDKCLSIIQEIKESWDKIITRIEYYKEEELTQFVHEVFNRITQEIITKSPQDGINRANEDVKNRLILMEQALIQIKNRQFELKEALNPSVENTTINVTAKLNQQSGIKHYLSCDELEKLFELLLQNRLISPQTTLEGFKAHFDERMDDSTKKIMWEGNEVDIVYFIEFLIEKRKLPNTQTNSLIREHFLNKKNFEFKIENLKNSKQNYLNSQTGKPKNSMLIEQIINTAIS